MPSLRDKALDSVLCTFRTSAITAGFVRSSQLSSSRPGQAVRSVREGGMDRPSHHKSHPAGSLSSSQPGGPPCWVISLAFGLTGNNFSKIKGWKVVHPHELIHAPCPSPPPCYLTVSLMFNDDIAVYLRLFPTCQSHREIIHVVYIGNTRDTQVGYNIKTAQLHNIYTENYVVNPFLFIRGPS
jgi:hypothetical protein